MREVSLLTGRFMFARSHAGDLGVFVFSVAKKECLRVCCWSGAANTTNSGRYFMLYYDVPYLCANFSIRSVWRPVPYSLTQFPREYLVMGHVKSYDKCMMRTHSKMDGARVSKAILWNACGHHV